MITTKEEVIKHDCYEWLVQLCINEKGKKFCGYCGKYLR